VGAAKTPSRRNPRAPSWRRNYGPAAPGRGEAPAGPRSGRPPTTGRSRRGGASEIDGCPGSIGPPTSLRAPRVGPRRFGEPPPRAPAGGAATARSATRDATGGRHIKQSATRSQRNDRIRASQGRSTPRKPVGHVAAAAGTAEAHRGVGQPQLGRKHVESRGSETEREARTHEYGRARGVTIHGARRSSAEVRRAQ